MAPEVSRSKIAITVPFSTEKQERVCSECGNDYTTGGWHWDDPTKLLCEYCWRDRQPEVDVHMGTFDRKLEESLPKGSILGPKVNGMRGVFRRNR